MNLVLHNTRPDERVSGITRRDALAAAMAALPLASWAQESWPTEAPRLVVPFPPGGTTDLVTRLVATEIARPLGQPVVVENKPGAGIVIGVDFVAKSAPDGATYVTVANSFSANVTLIKKLPYDSQRDLRPVAQMGMSEHVLATYPGSGLKSLVDVRTQALAHPGSISYASFGNGISAHLSGEMLAQALGVTLQHAPYKGQAPALADLLGGQIKLMFGNWHEFRRHVQSGKLVALGMATRQRSRLRPTSPRWPSRACRSSPTSGTACARRPPRRTRWCSA